MSAHSRVRRALAIAVAAPLVATPLMAGAASAHTPAARPRPVAVRAPVNARGLACPVGPGRNVTNSFGDARGGGRRHEGIDIMAPYGTPIYAIESGTIEQAYTNRRGGLSIYLHAVSGASYFYAHQSANLVAAGQSVTAGELIGRVGTSGNASSSAPHLHFEKHLSGRRPVDPYSLVKSVCG